MKLTIDSLPMYCNDCGDCLLWKLGVNSTGYPQANLDGKPATMVRRYVFTQLLGREIPKGHVVSTRCDSRLCVSPDHLIAMRRGAVQKRSYDTGKRMHVTEYASRLRSAMTRGELRLDWDKVRDIRSRPASTTNTALAAEFGVSHRCISDARRGESWKVELPASSVFAWRPAA